MEIIGIIIGALLVLGVGLAIYEWRKGRVLLAHDQNLDTRPRTELDTDVIRASEAQNLGTGSPGGSDGNLP